jgi:hypothetical protein
LFRQPTGSKVPPRITVVFWIIKILTTAMGEAVSDYLVHGYNPYAAVLAGFVAFAIAILIQFRAAAYVPWTYWLAVLMVAVFGTMAADVLHVEFGVPYVVSTVVFAVALVAIFGTWSRIEGTLSIHSITTSRRELFYWLAVLATFAMGTATGDLAAYTAKLGFLSAGLLFACSLSPPGDRLAFFQSQLGSGVLDRIRPDTAAWRIVRRLDGQIQDGRRPRDRRRGCGARALRIDRRPGHLGHVSHRGADPRSVDRRAPGRRSFELNRGQVFSPAFPSLRRACVGRTMVADDRRSTSAFVWPAGSVPDPSAVCRPFDFAPAAPRVR